MKIKAIIHPAEEGRYWAEVPALPGCITEGDSLEEVTHNLKDAIKGWLAVANESYEIKSFIGTSEVQRLERKGNGSNMGFDSHCYRCNCCSNYQIRFFN